MENQSPSDNVSAGVAEDDAAEPGDASPDQSRDESVNVGEVVKEAQIKEYVGLGHSA